MKRFHHLCLPILLFCAFAQSSEILSAPKPKTDQPTNRPTATKSPNILLFVVDDMGWMDSEPYGSEYYETPNMARLAQRGMRFTDAYSAHPLCSPTRASIMTGKYPARHGITTAAGHTRPDPPETPRYAEEASPNTKFIQPRTNRFLDPAEYTLAEALRDSGYATAHIGKWHLGLEPQHWPEANGFDLSFHGAPDPGPPSYHSPYQFKAGTVTDGPEGEYITDRITEEAVAFIKANADQPWFLNLWQYGVHGPWGHKEEYTKYFATKKDPRGEQDNPIMASMLKSVDDSLGRLLDTLDELGLTDSTLIFLTSDNGGNTHSNIESDSKTADIEEGNPRWAKIANYRKYAGYKPPTNNAPLRAGKAWLYEGGTRIPLIVSWPGTTPPGATSAAVAGSIDLYPTILEIMGLEKQPDQVIDGISLVPALKGAKSLEREALYNFFPHGGPGRPAGVTVRHGDFKLIRWFDPAGDYSEEFELYNLADDIGETANLAAAQPERVEAMRVLIESFLVTTGAAVPIPNPAYRPAASGNADDPLQGWIPKGGTAEIVDGALEFTPDSRQSFLAFTRFPKNKLTGPITIEVKTTSPTENLRLQWRTEKQETFPETGQIVDLTPEGTATFKTDAPLAHIRLLLPAETSTRIRSITLTPDLKWSFDEK